MLIQLQSKYLAIFELELELPAVEPRIILVDNAVEVWADDNDVRGVVVLRTGEVSMWWSKTASTPTLEWSTRHSATTSPPSSAI